MTLDLPDVAALVRRALAEDVGGRDLTTEAVVPPDRTARGVLLAKQELVVSGLDTASATFQALDVAVTFVPRAGEGERVSAGGILALVSGRARGILTGERVALNFLQRLSGVATLTRRFVEAVAGTGLRARGTRKTTPIPRARWDPAAGAAGGGGPLA